MEQPFFSGPGTKMGTIGGTLAAVFVHVSAGEIYKTIFFAGIGAGVSFFVTLGLRWVIKWVMGRRP
jgi:hypothetical protein